MRNVESNRNTSGRRALETRESMHTFQKKSRQGISVRQEQAVIPAPKQTTEVLCMHQRKVSKYTASEDTCEVGRDFEEIVHDAIKKSPNITLPEINDNCGVKPENIFRGRVSLSIERLRQERWEVSNALKLCLLVAKEIWNLDTCPHQMSDDNFEFMKVHLCPLYTSTLPFALRSLLDMVEVGRGWEYIKEIDRLSQLITRFSWKACPARKEYFQMSAEIYRRFLYKELDYLRHIKDSPLPFAVRNASNIIDRILRQEAPASYFNFLTRQDMNKIRDEKENLLLMIKSNIDGKGATPKTESLEELRKTMFSETAGLWAVRQYHDELRARLDEVMVKNKEEDVTGQQRACLLETLIVFSDQYSDDINEFRTLRQDVEESLIIVVKSILLVIAKDVDNADCWKAESLILIGHLYKENWPDKKYKCLYLHCMQAQKGMASITRMELAEYAQCLQQIDRVSVHLRIRHAHRDCFLMPADMFKQLYYDYGRLITSLDPEDELVKEISKIEQKLYTGLFVNVFNQLDRYKNANPNMSREDISHWMSSYRSHFINTKPYLFILYPGAMDKWGRIACSVWSDNLCELSKKKSFDKDDIDSLLHLKEIAPHVDDRFVRSNLIRTLQQLLRFILERSDTEYEFIEEIMELSRWIDELKELNIPMQLLIKLNVQWKEKYRHMMSAKTAASPDVPARVVPAYAHSDIAGVSPEAARHPHARQEITPERTATRRSFQQPVSVSDSTPVAQSETAISLQPRSQQQSSFQQPMVLPEDKPGHPLVNDIQRMPEQSAGPVKQLRLSPESRALSQVPIQDKEYQQQSILVARYGFTLSQPLSGQQSLDLPLPFEYPFGLSSSVFATDSALETCLRQYRPVEYTTHKMDNDNVVQGQRYLFCITRHYLQQKENGAYGSTPEMHFPASIGSCYYPAFMQGMAYLATWLLQINDGLVTQDDIYQPLMHLYDEDGDAMIRGLFDHLVKHQGRIGNFDIISNLFCFRNYLLFIRSLAGLRNDNQPASCSDKTGATCTVRQDTAGFAIEPDFVHDRTS